MTTRREVLILGAAAVCLSACGGGGGNSGTTLAAGGTSTRTPLPAPTPAPTPAPPPAPQGVHGTKIAEWTKLINPVGASVIASTGGDGAPSGTLLKVEQGAQSAVGQQLVLPEVTGLVPKGTDPGFPVGIWACNPGRRTLTFRFCILNSDGSKEIFWNCAVDPSAGWVFLTMSPTQQVRLGWQFGVDAPVSVRILQIDNQGEDPWQPGEYLLFGAVYVDLSYRPVFLITMDDGFASQRHAPSPTVASGQQVVERYGFKGSLFIVPGWLGTEGVYGYGKLKCAFLSAADVLAMHAEGWAIGSHSNTHPSSRDNAGLRLLGPYGYFQSNPIDNLSEVYARTWSLNSGHRRRVIGATAGNEFLAFENDPQLLVNQPIVFTDGAPPGFAVGTIYYCQETPTPGTASFATDRGTLLKTVVPTANWSGLANYRYPGSANDDSAIYADIMAAIDALTAMGITTGGSYFALPQGAADRYVRSACIRAGIKWIRGASYRGQTFAFGRPTGGSLSQLGEAPGGWIAHPDCVQTDGGVTPSVDQITQYVDTAVRLGACGCSYHHDVQSNTIGNLDALCAYLKTQSDARLIDVLTLDQLTLN